MLHLEAHGLRLDGLRLGLRVAHVDVVGQPGAPLPAKRHDLPALG